MPKPRTPTSVLELRGSFDRHPERRRGPEPRFAGRAICPRHLGPEAKAEWRLVAPQLRKLGLLTALDRTSFAGYCTAAGLVVQAERDIKRYGLMIGSRKNPAVGILKDALQLQRLYAGEFGLSPSSRSRVQAAPAIHVHGDDDVFGEIAAERYFKN